ncbi:SDR family oxidoreductase [bacterium]|nr:MAG: SDR family oxidoreductase [bacterium]
MERIALVTGGNRGIGFETARGLAGLGHRVLIGSRELARGEAVAEELRAQGMTVEAIGLDVDDVVSHANVAATIEERFGRLDVLVNNAAAIHDRDVRPSEVTVDVMRRTFETNFIMLVALTQRLLPLLRRSDAGRIVNLTSTRASLKINADPRLPMGEPQTLAYSASKAAVNLFTAMLALELRDTPIKVNSADPGWVKTEMGGEGATMEVADGARTSIRLATLPAEGPRDYAAAIPDAMWRR